MIDLTLTDDVFSSVQTSSVRTNMGFQHFHTTLGELKHTFCGKCVFFSEMLQLKKKDIFISYRYLHPVNDLSYPLWDFSEKTFFSSEKTF